MKKIKTLPFLFLMLVFLIPGTLLVAQDKETDKQRQAEMEEQMLERKKMLEEQQLQMKKQQEQMKELEKQFRVQVQEMPSLPDESGRARVYVRPERSTGYQFITGFDQGTHSQLTLRKSFEGTTDTSKGEFDVQPDVRNFRCMINGSVQSGEIHILLEYPDGKVFKELTINSSADINFSQSVSIREGEDSNFAGSWSYVIKADKAEGSYMLQITTN